MNHNSGLGVVRLTRDGKRRYDEDAKRALVEQALQPGVSVARLALEHGVNANLLRKWITKYLMEREKGAAPTRSQEIGSDQAASRDTPAAEKPDLREHDDGVIIDLPASRKNTSLAPSSTAFVPVITSAPPSLPAVSPPPMTLALQVRLANGVELDLGGAIASIDELTTMVQILGRMPCSGSTKI
jgi:transposase